jgi:hypothetical protein
MNLAWAGGQILGAGAGGALAKAAGDGVPIAITAALCAGTLLLLTRYSLTPAADPRKRSEAELRA